jgi:hypothetical protein
VTFLRSISCAQGGAAVGFEKYAQRVKNLHVPWSNSRNGNKFGFNMCSLKMWHCPIVIFLGLLLIVAEALNVVELSIDGLPSRIFPNVSFGLRFKADQQQCKWNGTIMSYTPNRRVQKDTMHDAELERLQLGVILAVGGHSDQHYDYGPAGSINGLMAVWDSWLENFFTYSSNTASLVLLFDERDFLKQNYTRSKQTYLYNIVVRNMGATPVDCVHMRHRHDATLDSVYKHHEIHVRTANAAAAGIVRGKATGSAANALKVPSLHHTGCTNELPLDQGYRVYYIDVARNHPTNINQKPLIIFAAVHRFPVPEWVKPEEEEKLFKTWKPWRLPGRFPTNYAYVKMTNWYSYHMLNLQVIDLFDYGGKLDNDVSFVAPFPEPNLPKRLVTKNVQMMATQNGWYYDDSRVAQGVLQCLNSWIAERSKECNDVLTRAGSGTSNNNGQLQPQGRTDPTFWEANQNATFRAHFLTFWFGLYDSPETHSLAQYWNDWHPRGMWDYRWGDQQWWPRPIAMFGTGDVSREIDHYDTINTDNEKYLVHKLWPRYGTISKGLYFNVSGSTKLDRDRIYNITSKPFIYR